MFGLACDQLVSLGAVLYNGTIVRANSTHHSDLLWASCGGGGGIAAVTEWEVKFLRLPGPNNLYLIDLKYDVASGDLAPYARVNDMLPGKTAAIISRFGGGTFGSTSFQVSVFLHLDNAPYMLSTNRVGAMARWTK